MPLLLRSGREAREAGACCATAQHCRNKVGAQQQWMASQSRQHVGQTSCSRETRRASAPPPLFLGGGRGEALQTVPQTVPLTIVGNMLPLPLLSSDT